MEILQRAVYSPFYKCNYFLSCCIKIIQFQCVNSFEMLEKTYPDVSLLGSVTIETYCVGLVFLCCINVANIASELYVQVELVQSKHRQHQVNPLSSDTKHLTDASEISTQSHSMDETLSPQSDLTQHVDQILCLMNASKLHLLKCFCFILDSG